MNILFPVIDINYSISSMHASIYSPVRMHIGQFALFSV